jgi:hypothetical protein
MKMRYVLPVALALTVPVSVGWAQKNASLMDPDKLPKVECSELHFSKAFLDKYPKAPAACQEAREYKGQRYAKFTARVYLTGKDRTTVEMLDKDGNMVTTFSVRPGPNSSVKMGDHEVKFHDLQKGEKISFWVPEKRLGAQELPGPTKDRWTVAPPTE